MIRRTYSHSLPLPPLYNYLLIGLGVLAGLVIILVVYYSLGGAVITVKPSWQEQKVGLIANIVDQTKTSSSTVNQLPGYLKTYDQQVSGSFTASSSTPAQAPIVGVIEIVNNSSKSQALVATTRFLTADNLLFRLDKGVTVPAYGKIQANLTASGNDDKFLIGQNPTKLTIPGLWAGLQSKIYGLTIGQLAKKTSHSFQITPDNLNAAQTALQQKALANIKNQADQAGLKISADQIVIASSTLKTDPTPDANGNFTANLNVKAAVVIFNASQLPDLAASTLPDVYKSANTKIQIEPDSFTYQLTLLDANSENLLAQLHGDYKLKIANYALSAAALAGLTKTEAEQLLKDNGEYNSYNIKIPFWSSHLPKDPDQIKIIFQ